MTQIERELADYLNHLSITSGPGPQDSAAGQIAASYIEESLAGWGFATAHAAKGLTLSEPRSPGHQIVARIGSDLPSTVVLYTCLHQFPAVPRDAESVAGAAVILALGRLLSQHHLRHGVEIIVLESDAQPVRLATIESLHYGLGEIVAAIGFDRPGQFLAPNLVSTCDSSPQLTAGVRKLMARYPEVIWREPESWGEPQILASAGIPGLTISGSAPSARLGYSTRRMREAAMLGAEIVALLQTYTPASSRPTACGVGL